MSRRPATSMHGAGPFTAWLVVIAVSSGWTLGCTAAKSDGMPPENALTSDGSGGLSGQGGRAETDGEGSDGALAPDGTESGITGSGAGAPDAKPDVDDAAGDGCALECGPVDAGKPDGPVRGLSTLTGWMEFADASTGDAMFSIETTAGVQTLTLVVDSADDICSQGTGNARVYHEFASLKLIGTHVGGEVVFAPGTYPYGAPVTAADGTRIVFDDGLVMMISGAYGIVTGEDVTAGAITVTSHVGGILQGHFELTLDFSDAVAGTFTAPFCPSKPP